MYNTILAKQLDTCILVQQEHMYSCSTRAHVFLFNTNTCVLAQQEHMCIYLTRILVFLVDKEYMHTFSTWTHVCFFQNTWEEHLRDWENLFSRKSSRWNIFQLFVSFRKVKHKKEGDEERLKEVIKMDNLFFSFLQYMESESCFYLWKCYPSKEMTFKFWKNVSKIRLTFLSIFSWLQLVLN